MRSSLAFFGLALCLALSSWMSPRGANAAWSNDPAINLPVYTGGTVLGPLASVSDGAGGVLIFWVDSRNQSTSGLDVYAQHVLAAGDLDPRWPAGGLAVASSAGDDAEPRLLADGSGGAIVAWLQAGACTCVPDVPDGCSCDYLHNSTQLHHVLAAGKLDPSWPAAGVSASGPAYCLRGAEIVSDGSGGAVVAFDSWTADSGFVGLHLQHVLASGTVDAAWPAGGRRLSPGLQIWDLPRESLIGSVPDGQGGALVAWTTVTVITDPREPTPPPVIFVAQHVMSSGAIDPVWPADGLVQMGRPAAPREAFAASGGSPDHTAEGSNDLIVSDGAGGAILAWLDGPVFAQRILARGMKDPAWPVDGLPLCTNCRPEGHSTMAPDDLGGAIVAWQDDRSSVSGDLYAQHVRRSGRVDSSWPENGQPVCSATDEQWNLAIISTQGGGTILSWDDFRSGATMDIYAQRLLSTGAPIWQSDGQVVHVSTHRQVNGNVMTRSIVSDGGAGAILAWRDDRDGKGDLYAQLIGSRGELGRPKKAFATTRDPSDGLELAGIGSNPLRSEALLRVTLQSRASAKLEILDASGRRLRTLDDGVRESGVNVVKWDLRDERGAEIPSGLYFARLMTDRGSVTLRLVKL